ncbi:MAG: Mut7-C RNAse domain-containing protein [Candidatus Thorarchaeota archaeon]|jgi:uncharacterized protein with PIN domain
MKFIVDAMLGKLALWLRLAGYDTVYSPDIDDNDILDIASRESRILLTSDAALHRRSVEEGLQTSIVRGDVDERIARVFREYNLEPIIDPSKSRCSKCNGELQSIKESEKPKVKDLVFEQTYDNYEEFWLCSDCQSVFWKGGHWVNIQKYAKGIEELMERVDSD